MKKQQVRLLALVVAVILFLGMIGVLFMARNSYKQTESNTVEYTATVTDLRVIDFGKEKSISIYTEEYDYYFHIGTIVGSKIDEGLLSLIQTGDKITCRIEDSSNENLDGAIFVPIVALETEDGVVFSLSDYNALMKEASKPAKVVGVIVSLVFLSGAIYFATSLIKNRFAIST